MSGNPLNSTPTALATWLSVLRATRRSAATIQAYQYAVDGLLGWLGANDADEILTLNRRQATAYVAHLGTLYKPGGNRSRIRSLRVFFNWAIEEGEYTDPNPFAKLMPQAEDCTMAVPSDDDIAAMLKRAKAGPSKRDLAMVQILVTTGCRKGELGALTDADIDFDNRLISFRVSKTRARVVPMHDDVVVALGRWMRARPSKPTGLWDSTCPYDLVDTVVYRASAGLWRSHSLRRYFAVNWMQRGGSEASLIRLCGWKDGTMLRHYIAARADEIADDEYRRLMD